MPNYLGDMVVRIVGDNSEFNKTVDQSKKTFNDFGTQAILIGQTLMEKVTKPLIALGRSAIESSAQFQMYVASFTTMLNSGQKAADLMARLKDLAAKTPFELPGLADSAKMLLQFGIAEEELIPRIRQLGDIAQGNNGRFQSLALAFGQMSAAGKLMGQDLLQMINAGFNPLQVMSEKTGMSMGVLKKQMASGAISVEMVKKAFEIATAEGGRFHDGMANGAKQFTGLVSTMNDDINSMKRSFGDLFIPTAMKVVKQVSEIAKGIEALSPPAKIAITTIGSMVAAIGPLILVIKALNVALTTLAATNPIVLALVAITALTVGITSWVNAMKEAKKERDKLWHIDESKSIKENIDQLEKLRKTVNQYFRERDELVKGSPAWKLADAKAQDAAAAYTALADSIREMMRAQGVAASASKEAVPSFDAVAKSLEQIKKEAEDAKEAMWDLAEAEAEVARIQADLNSKWASRELLDFEAKDREAAQFYAELRKESSQTTAEFITNFDREDKAASDAFNEMGAESTRMANARIANFDREDKAASDAFNNIKDTSIATFDAADQAASEATASMGEAALEASRILAIVFDRADKDASDAMKEMGASIKAAIDAAITDFDRMDSEASDAINSMGKEITAGIEQDITEFDREDKAAFAALNSYALETEDAFTKSFDAIDRDASDFYAGLRAKSKKAAEEITAAINAATSIASASMSFVNSGGGLGGFSAALGLGATIATAAGGPIVAGALSVAKIIFDGITEYAKKAQQDRIDQLKTELDTILSSLDRQKEAQLEKTNYSVALWSKEKGFYTELKTYETMTAVEVANEAVKAAQDALAGIKSAYERQKEFAKDAYDAEIELIEKTKDAKITKLDEEEQAALYAIGAVGPATLAQYEAEIAAAVAAGDHLKVIELQRERNAMIIREEFAKKREAAEKEANEKRLQAENSFNSQMTTIANQQALELAVREQKKAEIVEKWETKKREQISLTAIAVARAADKEISYINELITAHNALYGTSLALLTPPPIPVVNNNPNMATGGIVMPRVGGTAVNVAEAGSPEVIFPLAELEKFMSTYSGSSGGDGNINLIVSLDSKPFLNTIFPATKNRTVLISGGAVVS